MLYSFARVSAVLGMRRQDYFGQANRAWLRLHEKGGNRHDVPAHHRAAAALDAYVEVGGLEEPKVALFQTVDPAWRRLTGRALDRRLVLAMIKRRASAAGAAALDPRPGRPPFVSVLARLAQDVSFEQADARAAALAPQWDPAWASSGVTTRLRSLNQLAALGIDARFSWVQQRRGALFLLFGAVACVLLIACANAANLFLSRALLRAPEFAIRAAAGASWPRLCRQLLTESVVTSALAGLLGLALAAWLIGVAAAAVPPDLARRLLNPIDLDARVAFWAVLAALLAGVAATLPPALRTIGRDLMRPLQGRGAVATVGPGRLRSGLVVVQNALAVVLLIGALLMGRSLWTLLDVDIGWTAENAVALEPRLSGPRYQGPEARSRFLAQLADLTATAPGVETAAPAEQVPFLPSFLSFGRLETDEAGLPSTMVTINYVTDRYFPAAGIPSSGDAGSVRKRPGRMPRSSAGTSRTGSGRPARPSGSGFGCPSSPR